MELHPIFKLSEETSPELLELLNSVTLGTNGAQYRHLDTTNRIFEADNPLHLTLERNNKIIGNITVCRRENHWYVRYFAFDLGMQSTGKFKSKGAKTGLLKQELQKFFDTMLVGDPELGKIDSFYAYIDPNNQKSLWMSESFGFESIGNIATQTFSRVNPKERQRVERIDDWRTIEPLIEEKYSRYNYYFLDQTKKPPFYMVRNSEGEVIACAKISLSKWEIKQLPGRYGSLLVKIIPFVPWLNKLIRPKEHTFVVPEAVVVKDNDANLLSELFEGILYREKQNLILWWVDEKEPLHAKNLNKIKWGLLHKLIGVTKANIMVKTQTDHSSGNKSQQPFYTSGFDFI